MSKIILSKPQEDGLEGEGKKRSEHKTPPPVAIIMMLT